MPLSPTVAMLPETPDSRLLAELSSYSDDLSEASDAIEQALEAGHESPLWQPLTSYAVVAYMRAFAHPDALDQRRVSRNSLVSGNIRDFADNFRQRRTCARVASMTRPDRQHDIGLPEDQR